MIDKEPIPKFATEAEEAQQWYEQRDRGCASFAGGFLAILPASGRPRGAASGRSDRLPISLRARRWSPGGLSPRFFMVFYNSCRKT